MKKSNAIAAIAGGIAALAALSLTGAADEEIVAAQPEAPIMEELPAESTPEEPPESAPADPAPEDVPALDPLPEVTPAPEDLPAAPPFEYVEAVPWVPGAPIGDLPPAPIPGVDQVIHEDDPRWDCRTMGNQRCGVEIMGTIYVITFENGAPAGVYQR